MQRLLSVVGLLAALGGCAGLADPYQRQGTWVPEGVNDANLRAMVANPVDLQHGTGATDNVGVTAATAVQRYRAGNVQQLPESNISSIGASSTPNTLGAGAGTAQ